MGLLVFNSQSSHDIGVPVVRYDEAAAPSFYTPGSRLVRYPFEPAQTRKKRVNKVVLHHDGMGTSRGCFGVLRQRRLSTHIMIDRDGTVYQPMALQDVAIHVAGHNHESIGIDLNNPVRRDRLRRGDPGGKVFQQRINDGVHKSLGYTDAQYESLAAVLEGIFQLFGEGIRREAPIGEDGRVVARCLTNPKDFSGIVAHWHLKASKWDPGPGFDWERMLVGVRASRVFYPITLPGQRNLGQVSKRHASDLAQGYFEHIEAGDGGFFPVGVNQAWHTGAHLQLRKEGAPVLAPAKGRVLVARNAERTPKLGDANVVVLGHELEVGDRKLEFFTVLSHVRFQPEMGSESPIPWMKRLATKPPPDLPDDQDEPRSWPGANALRRGWVALLDVPVEAGEVVGHAGVFSSDPNSAPLPMIDVATISKRPLFPKSDRTFEVVDDDDDNGLLCNSRAVWRRLVVEPEELDGLVRGGYPLAPSEVRDAYAERSSARELRRLAVRHVTEWSEQTDLRDLFGGGVDFEWYALRDEKRHKALFRPFLWWDAGVTKHAKLPKDGLVYAYHPITLLTVLGMGQARTAMSVGQSGAQQGLDDDALKDQKKKERTELGDLYHHEHFDTRDLKADEDVDDVEGTSPEWELWMRWEQGEWPPPEK